MSALNFSKAVKTVSRAYRSSLQIMSLFMIGPLIVGVCSKLLGFTRLLQLQLVLIFPNVKWENMYLKTDKLQPNVPALLLIMEKIRCSKFFCFINGGIFLNTILPPPPPRLPFQTLIRLTQKTSILDKLRTQPLRQKRLHRRTKMKPIDQLQYPRGSDWPLELLGCSIFRWSPDTQVCIYQNPSP